MEKIIRIMFTVISIVIVIFGIYVFSVYQNYTDLFSLPKNRNETKYIIIHHDGIDRQTNVNEIYTFHKLKRNFNSIAYHYYLTKSKIIQLHLPDEYTNHALGMNNESVSVCLHGDFNKTQLTKIQRFNLYLTVWFLQVKYKVSASMVKGHNEVGNTDCPGSNVNINEIRRFLLW